MQGYLICYLSDSFGAGAGPQNGGGGHGVLSADHLLLLAGRHGLPADHSIVAVRFPRRRLHGNAGDKFNIWTLAEARYHSITDHFLVPLVVLSLASLIMLTNLYLAGREVALVRVAAPQRMQEDDAALHPVAIEKASSPWDDDSASTEMPPGS